MGGSGRNLRPVGPVQTANKLSIEQDIIYPQSLYTVGQPQCLSHVIEKDDSGATSHYWRKTDTHTLLDVQATSHGATVQLPDSSTISVTAVGRLPLPASLTLSATNTHVFDDLHSAYFISLGKLCDNNCVSILDKHKIQVIKESKVVMQGHRNADDGLWDIPIKKNFQKKALSIITRDKTKIELIQYLCGCCFSPTPHSFLCAIKNGNLLTWPGLNIPNITY